MKRDFTGLIAASFTPMHEDGSVNLDRIGAIVDHLVRDGVAGVYVAGSTGEGISLTSQERRQVAEAIIRSAKGRLSVIVHVGHNSLREARELAAHAQQIGADAISAVAPSYFKPTSVEVLVDCMAEIASAAPKLPFYGYHIPSLTGIRLDPAEFLRQAAKCVPNLGGLKFTAPEIEEYQACLDLAKGRFTIFYGRDEMLLSALSVGARAAIGSTYNFATPLYRRLIEAFDRGDIQEARRCQALAAKMIRTIERYPIMPGLKAVMKIIGVDCGPTRLPLAALNSKQIKMLKRELEEIGFFQWARPCPDK